MGILKAENNVSYTANNACKIYIIKQVEIGDTNFQTYLDYINGSNGLLDELGRKLININPTSSSSVKLTKLISYSQESEKDYTKIDLNVDAPDCPVDRSAKNFPSQFIEHTELMDFKIKNLWFYTELLELINCPLVDLSKEAYVFQIEGQTKSGLANVVSFNTSFSVNGQSSCSIVINNLDYKYNFKYFNEPEKYKYHLKPFFDTNDIIIVRFQNKKIKEESLLNSFKKSSIDYWQDPYISYEGDPLTTIFTGYINDINQSFSFANGQQTMELVCTGPSKKLTWSRVFNNRATNDVDSSSALLPISAYINSQTFDATGKPSKENKNVLKNLLLRTYSDLLSIPGIRDIYNDYMDVFEESKNILTSKEYNYYLKQLENAKTKDEIKKAQQELKNYKSLLQEGLEYSKKVYNDLIETYMNNFVFESKDSILIVNNSFLSNSDKCSGRLPTFIILGTNQQAYQWQFQNWQLYISDFSTVYQFIKGIADKLHFNFYDDPYGTIHFGIPDVSLAHLQNGKHPNNIKQLISFSESQNTENIANIYFGKPQHEWASIDLSGINNVCVKDYNSIAKYGEKVMQPQQFTGITSPEALKYMLQSQMIKNNRKALSHIRINIQGEPNIKFDKYAYIKELKKLFYIESYSHSYNAGGQFTTSINGTYTRPILCIENSVVTEAHSEIDKVNKESSKIKYPDKNNLQVVDSYLSLIESYSNYIKALENLIIVNFNPKFIYDIYKKDFNYPNDANLELEITSLYTKEVILSCLLDGYFWALPFTVDPYSIAKNIAEEEIKRQNWMNKLFKEKDKELTTSSNRTTPKTEPIKPIEQKTIDYKTSAGQVVKLYEKDAKKLDQYSKSKPEWAKPKKYPDINPNKIKLSSESSQQLKNLIKSKPGGF